jgi:serine/threonine-protein kinase RsbW
MWSRSQEEPVVDIWWSLHLRREPASVPLARHILLGTMASAGVDPDVSHEVGVALTEACANAVEHAGPRAGTGQDSGFQVTATIESGCLRVEITDSGPGFSAADAAAADAAADLAADLAADFAAELAAGLGADPTAGLDPAAPGGTTAVRARPCVRLRRGALNGPALVRALPSRTAVEDDFAPFTGIPADAGQELPDLSAESGRGLFLIRALMDHVQFRNHPRSGAVVSFDKVLKYREQPLLHAS